MIALAIATTLLQEAKWQIGQWHDFSKALFQGTSLARTGRRPDRTN